MRATRIFILIEEKHRIRERSPSTAVSPNENEDSTEIFYMTLRTLHRTSAILITAFAIVHLANHLASLSSVASHITFMEVARGIYRQPAIEVLLLFCVAIQVVSGLRLVVSAWTQRRGRIAWLQAIAGAYLGFFLLAHVSAILFGRTVFNLDTNFYFAAAGFHVHPYQFFFAPYYFFAVLALFTHLGCALYWQAKSNVARKLAITLPILLGSVIALLIVLSLAGSLKPVEVPEKYKAIYPGGK